MIDFYPITQSFKEYLEILNRSPNTIRIHMHRLGKFVTFLEQFDLKDLREITVEHLLEYQKFRHYYNNKNNQARQIGSRDKNVRDNFFRPN